MKINLTGFGNIVDDVTGAILAVLKVDFSLAGPFHRDGEGSGASFPGPDVELARLTLLAALQAGATGVDAMSAAIAQGTHRELEGRAGDVHLLVLHRHGC